MYKWCSDICLRILLPNQTILFFQLTRALNIFLITEYKLLWIILKILLILCDNDNDFNIVKCNLTYA